MPTQEMFDSLSGVCFNEACMPTQEMFDSLSGVLELEVMGCATPPSTFLARIEMERDAVGNNSASGEIGEVVSRGAAVGITAAGTTVALGVMSSIS